MCYQGSKIAQQISGKCHQLLWLLRQCVAVGIWLVQHFSLLETDSKANSHTHTHTHTHTHEDGRMRSAVWRIRWSFELQLTVLCVPFRLKLASHTELACLFVALRIFCQTVTLNWTTTSSFRSSTTCSPYVHVDTLHLFTVFPLLQLNWSFVSF